MRYPASEKLEIIRLVEGSHLSARLTLAKLGIPRTTFYRWYDRYLQRGEAGLQDQSPKPKHVWMYSVNHLVRQRQPLWPVCEPLWCCLFSGVLVCNLLWLILERCCRWRVCVGFLVVAGRAPAETLCIHL
jgi:hypothetical protein